MLGNVLVSRSCNCDSNSIAEGIYPYDFDRSSLTVDIEDENNGYLMIPVVSLHTLLT